MLFWHIFPRHITTSFATSWTYSKMAFGVYPNFCWHYFGISSHNTWQLASQRVGQSPRWHLEGIGWTMMIGQITLLLLYLILFISYVLLMLFWHIFPRHMATSFGASWTYSKMEFGVYPNFYWHYFGISSHDAWQHMATSLLLLIFLTSFIS